MARHAALNVARNILDMQLRSRLLQFYNVIHRFPSSKIRHSEV